LGSRVRIPSPAPSFSEIPEICGKPSTRRSSKSVVYTKRLHNDARDGDSSPQISSINRHAGVYTKRLHKRPTGLCLKRAVYQYRRRVPTDLVTVLGCREIWRTLGTDSFAVAVRRIHRAAAMVESQFEQARADLGRASDLTLSRPLADGPPPQSGAQYFAPQAPLVSGQASTQPRSIGEVYDMFISDPRHTWSKRTVIAHETTRKWVIEAFDADTAITDITRENPSMFFVPLTSISGMVFWTDSRPIPMTVFRHFRDHDSRGVIGMGWMEGGGRPLFPRAPPCLHRLRAKKWWFCSGLGHE